jgi:ribosome assembly protein RRB1
MKAGPITPTTRFYCTRRRIQSFSCLVIFSLSAFDPKKKQDPTVDFLDVPHPAGVNRVRSCPHRAGVVATWGDDAKVRIYDLTAHGAALAGAGPKLHPAAAAVAPAFEFGGHAEEGYAVDWSKVAPGWLATGDCAGKIHVWQPAEGSVFAAGAAGASGGLLRWGVEQVGRSEHVGSVEDLQWSPSEATVFISCGVDRSIKVRGIACERCRFVLAKKNTLDRGRSQRE